MPLTRRSLLAESLLLAGTAGTASGSPNMPEHSWSNPTLPPDDRAARVVAAMTAAEKFAWLSGPLAVPAQGQPKLAGALGSAGYYPAIPRLGIPAMQQTDAGLGVGNQRNVRPGDNATALPCILLLGATFDPEIAQQAGALIGQEARAKGFCVLLGGGAVLIREPRCGRNFEYVSEDPLLTGLIAGASIAGIQSQGVVSTIKHFALNAQETGRVMVNAELAEAALRESDLLAFQIAIEVGKPGAVMAAYNLVNGTYCTENSFLLDSVLKCDWAYPGWVMSDWGATHSTERAIMAGLDVQSGANLDPEPYFGAPLRAAVAEGRVPQGRIDDAVRRQLRSLFAAGVVDNPPIFGQPIDYSAHRLLAQRCAEAGIVLLKNDGPLLPFAKGARRILVVGHHADAGVLSGGGSSQVTPVGSVRVNEPPGSDDWRVYHPSSPLRALKEEANAATVDFANGSDVAAAATAARAADLVVVLAEEWRAEGMDARELTLPGGQDALIDALATANPHTVVVLLTGGPVVMPWLAKVPAVLAAFYPGAGGGEAIAGVLFGRVNPSGRLPISFPADMGQLPRVALHDPATTTSDPATPRKGGIFPVSYDIEGSDVGYRWYQRQDLKPLFAFGHGLSYTRFAYSGFQVSADSASVVATVSVRNTGDRAGAETVQLYAARGDAPGFVPRLAGFSKVYLAPGEATRVEMRVDPRLLARFDAGQRAWQTPGGDYDFTIRRSADVIIARATIRLAAASFPP